MSQERKAQARLTPFTFPAETEGRFRMLVVAALALSASLGSVWVAGSQSTDFRALLTRYRQEVQRRNILVYELPPAEVATMADRSLARCKVLLRRQVKRLAPPFLCVLLLAIGSTLYYRAHPRRILRRYRPRPLTREQAPRVVADLERCATRLELALPRLGYVPDFPNPDGHAFGLAGQEILLLHAPLEALEKSWDDGLRVVALHELGHIANRDAGDREKAKAVWLALMLLMLGFAFAASLGWAPWGSWSLLLQGLATLAAVWAIWAGLIRMREFYADWRAASLGAGPELSILLAGEEDDTKVWERWDWWWEAWRRWGDRRWWQMGERLLDLGWRPLGWLARMHPSWAARRRCLKDPGELFRISPDLPFLTGLLLTLALVGLLPALVDLLLAVQTAARYGYANVLRNEAFQPSGVGRDLRIAGAAVTLNLLIPILVIIGLLSAISYLVIRTLGTQVQRQAVASLVNRPASTNWGYARLLPTAALWAAGMEVGFLIAPFSSLTPLAITRWAVLPVWLAGFTGFTWLWLVYVHGMSRFLLGSHLGRQFPRLRQALLTGSSVVLLTVLYWPAALARLTAQASFLLTADRALSVAESRRLFVYGFLGTTTILMVFAVAVYILWVLAALLALWLVLLRRHGRCPHCRRVSHFRINLGRLCEGCKNDLASWVFDDPSTPTSS